MRAPEHLVFVTQDRSTADSIAAMLAAELPGWTFSIHREADEAMAAISLTDLPAAVILAAPPPEVGNDDTDWIGGQLASLTNVGPSLGIVVIARDHDRDAAIALLTAGAQDVLVAKTFGARTLADAVTFAACRARNGAAAYPGAQAMVGATGARTDSPLPADAVTFQPSPSQAAAPATTGSMEMELQHAIGADQLVLHYQPVIDLTGARVIGMEALVRWSHPSLGLIAPGAFIPVAESSGLIVPLGLWVLREACRQAAAWRAQFARLQVSVNFSARQLEMPGVVEAVRQVLRDSGLAPQRLLIEVTEAALVSDRATASETLTRIAAIGVEIALDDFGSGTNSISALKGLPIKVLKIDRAFVAGVGADTRANGIVASVIGLAHAVGASCLAEGVETFAQLTALRGMGCDLAQGFYLGQPGPAAAMRAMIQECDLRLAELPT